MRCRRIAATDGGGESYRGGQEMATLKSFRKLTLVRVVLPAFRARTAACSVPDELAMPALVRVKEPLNISIVCPLLEHTFTPSRPIRIQRRPAGTSLTAAARLKRWRQMRIKEGP